MSGRRVRPPLQKPNQGRPQHACSCRDKLQQQVALRREGLSVPPLGHRDLWVPFPQCTDATHAGKIVPFCGSWASFSPGCQPGSESSPSSDGRFLGSPLLWYCPPLSGGRRPLTHSPRKEVVSGPAHTEGAHTTASGRLAGVALFEQSALLSCGSLDAVSLGCQPGRFESATFVI